MRIQFQTGRSYSANGQRIIAVHELIKQQVRFKDLDRHVSGTIPCLTGRSMDRLDLRDFVMFNYDCGNVRYGCSDEYADLEWED